MTSTVASESQIQVLKNYTACDIADVLLKLKVPNAGFIPDLNLYAPSSASEQGIITIAPASTVMFAAKSGADAASSGGNIPTGKHWVDLTEPDTIVVLAQPKGQKCAVLGGIMALRIKVLEAKGIVVNGRIRDLQELRATGLPIWAQKTSIVGLGGEAKPHAVQIPLDLDGTLVNPGDLVFSDSTNGVAIIPQDLVAEVVALLPSMAEADELVMKDVGAGSTVQEAFKKHRGSH